MKTKVVKINKNKTCKGCNGLGFVTNYVCGIEFQEECQSCKGTGDQQSKP